MGPIRIIALSPTPMEKAARRDVCQTTADHHEPATVRHGGQPGSDPGAGAWLDRGRRVTNASELAQVPAIDHGYPGRRWASNGSVPKGE